MVYYRLHKQHMLFSEEEDLEFDVYRPPVALPVRLKVEALNQAKLLGCCSSQ